MQLFCQSCQTAHASSTHCPKCGSRLLAPQESFIHSAKAKDPPPDAAAPTFLNRLVVGTLVALGVAFGLRELAAVVAAVSSGSLADGWTHSNADATTFAARLIAVIIGGLIAGAGRGEGLQVGAALGFLVGTLFTALDVYAAGKVQDILSVVLMGAYPLAASIAGAAGTWIWPLEVFLPEPTRLSSRGSSMMSHLAEEDAIRRTAKPTAWLQIAAGAVLAMIGVIASDPIRLGLAKFSGGLFNTAGVSKSAILGLEIGAVTALLGGVIAAMGTGAGFRHGFFAGVLAVAGLLIGAVNRADGTFPAVEGFIKVFALEAEPLTHPKTAMHVLMSLLALMTAAGWLSGQLFPPLAPKRLRTKSLQRQS